MPTVPAIQKQAENKAISILEGLRREIVLSILGANVSDPHSGARYEVRAEIAAALDYVANKFKTEYEQAWAEGVRQGGAASTSSTTIAPQLSRFYDITTSAFKSLAQSIESDTNTLLTRAALKTLTQTEVLAKVGQSQASGSFKQYQARAVGIVTYEVAQIAGYAQQLRAIEASKNAAAAIAKSGKGLEYVFLTMWLHGDPMVPRENHLAMDGKTVVTGTDFALDTDQGVVMCIGPHAGNLPIGEVANCFHPDNFVSGEFVAASRFLYSGKMREIKTRSGVSLAVTPNHPIATGSGWVRAGDLHEGDYVLAHNINIPDLLCTTSLTAEGLPRNDKKKPARIDEVFRTFELSGLSETIRLSALQFHGDAKSGESDVEIVFPKRDSELFSLGGGIITDGDSTFFEIGVERRTGNSDFLSEIRTGFTGAITSDEIVEVRDYDFSGHVYDVQTTSGALVTSLNSDNGGIICHNCQCSSIPKAYKVTPAVKQAIEEASVRTGGIGPDELARLLAG